MFACLSSFHLFVLLNCLSRPKVTAMAEQLEAELTQTGSSREWHQRAHMGLAAGIKAYCELTSGVKNVPLYK